MKKMMIIGLAVVVVVVAAVTVVLAMRNNDKPAANSDGDGQSRSSSQPLEVVLGAAAQYRYGQTVEIKSIVRNISDEVQTYTFTSTCTQGILRIDGKKTQQSQGCGDAITDVMLQPDEAREYTYTFKLEREIRGGNNQPLDGTGETIDFDGKMALQPGWHQAYLEWKGVKSELISFEVVE
jgi:hypothetical protein